MDDLIDLWLELDLAESQLLRRLRVSARAARLVGGVCQERVVWRASRLFEFDIGGEYALIVPAFSDPPSIENFVAEPRLHDLLAVDPRRPTDWALLRGTAAMLGEVVLREALFFCEPLSVHRDPLPWLRMGGCGVMPIDWTACAVAFWGDPPLQLIAEDLDHGNELERHLSALPGKPEILLKIRDAA